MGILQNFVFRYVNAVSYYSRLRRIDFANTLITSVDSPLPHHHHPPRMTSTSSQHAHLHTPHKSLIIYPVPHSSPAQPCIMLSVVQRPHAFICLSPGHRIANQLYAGSPNAHVPAVLQDLVRLAQPLATPYPYPHHRVLIFQKKRSAYFPRPSPVSPYPVVFTPVVVILPSYLCVFNKAAGTP